MRQLDGQDTATIVRVVTTPLRAVDTPPHVDRSELWWSIVGGVAAAAVVVAEHVTGGRSSIVVAVVAGLLTGLSATAWPRPDGAVTRAASTVGLGAFGGLVAVAGVAWIDASPSSGRVAVLWGVALLVAARPRSSIGAHPLLLVVATVSAASAVLLAGALVIGAWTALALIAAAALPLAAIVYLWSAADDQPGGQDVALIAGAVGLGAVWWDDVALTDAIAFTLAVVVLSGVVALSMAVSAAWRRPGTLVVVVTCLLVLPSAPAPSSLCVVVVAAGVMWTTHRSRPPVDPEPGAAPHVPTDDFEAARRVSALRSTDPVVLPPPVHTLSAAHTSPVVDTIDVHADALDTADAGPDIDRDLDRDPDRDVDTDVDMEVDTAIVVTRGGDRAAAVDVVAADTFHGMMGRGRSPSSEPDDRAPLDRLGAALDEIERLRRRDRRPPPA